MDKFNRIQFKAWDKKKKKMRQVNMMDIRDGSIDSIIYWKKTQNPNEMCHIEEIKLEQLEFKIIQSIGLKDMDGNLIYEKFIIKDINFPNILYKVVFDDDKCQYKFLKIEDNRPLIKISKRYCANYLKIIGNEFENPELLKK